eukprot:1536963-Pleurochrysis_carterae.AAC.2
MHVFASESGLRKTAALLLLLAITLIPANSIAFCVGTIVALPLYSPLLRSSLRSWARSPSQGTSVRRESAEPLAHLARATPLTCAREDARQRAVQSVAKFRFLSATESIALALIHSYWLLGHRVLGLRE